MSRQQQGVELERDSLILCANAVDEPPDDKLEPEVHHSEALDLVRKGLLVLELVGARLLLRSLELGHGGGQTGGSGGGSGRGSGRRELELLVLLILDVVDGRVLPMTKS